MTVMRGVGAWTGTLLLPASLLGAPAELRVVQAGPVGEIAKIEEPTRYGSRRALRAVARSRSRLAWEVDGRAVGSALLEAAVPWPLAPGRHVVSVRDEHGRRDEAEIMVK